jgi:hypothetical protein
MPILKYFGFVSSGLLALLFGLNWLMPERQFEPARAEAGSKFAIRISSIEKLPERVVFDTSVPSPLPRVDKATVAVLKNRQQPMSQSAFVFAQITPGPLPTFEAKRRSRQVVPKISFNYPTNHFQPLI